MPKYHDAATVTVDGASEELIGSPEAGATYEIFSADAPVWINITGGAASVDGADCIRIPKDGAIEFVVSDQSAINAIRDGGTSAVVTWAKIS